MRSYDELDIKILNELEHDSSISIPKLAEKLGIRQSIPYNRIKKLVNAGMIKKFTIIVDDRKLGINVHATVGIKRDSIHKDLIHDQLMSIPQVLYLSEVTGRFDILLYISAENLDILHSIVIDKIGKIQGINNTETFIELQKTDKDKNFKR